MRTLTIIALVLVIVGAINWGLIGFFGWNLVGAIFGPMSAMARIIYALVGLAGLYTIGVLTRYAESTATYSGPRLAREA